MAKVSDIGGKRLISLSQNAWTNFVICQSSRRARNHLAQSLNR